VPVLLSARSLGDAVARPLDLEIAEPAHGLGTQAVARRGLEELAIRLDGRGAARLDGGVALDHDLLPLQAAQRWRSRLLGHCAGAEQAGARQDRAALHCAFSVTRSARS